LSGASSPERTKRTFFARSESAAPGSELIHAHAFRAKCDEISRVVSGRPSSASATRFVSAACPPMSGVIPGIAR
jgi:hypothetical protein